MFTADKERLQQAHERLLRIGIRPGPTFLVEPDDTVTELAEPMTDEERERMEAFNESLRGGK